MGAQADQVGHFGYIFRSIRLVSNFNSRISILGEGYCDPRIVPRTLSDAVGRCLVPELRTQYRVHGVVFSRGVASCLQQQVVFKQPALNGQVPSLKSEFVLIIAVSLVDLDVSTYLARRRGAGRGAGPAGGD